MTFQVQAYVGPQAAGPQPDTQLRLSTPGETGRAAAAGSAGVCRCRCRPPAAAGPAGRPRESASEAGSYWHSAGLAESESAAAQEPTRSTLASWEACNLACNGCNYMSYMLDVMGL